jgi:hypothetical protein
VLRKVDATDYNTEWADPTGGSPAGSGTELQYRAGASLGAAAGTAWNAVNQRISFGAGASPSGKVHLQSGAASEVGLIAQAAVSQTANLHEIRNSTGGVMAAFLASGVLHINTENGVGPTNNQLWLGNISNPGSISLRGNPATSGQYGLGFHSSIDATFLYGYAGRKFALGTRQYGGQYNERFTFNDENNVQTWTHSEGINYVFGTSTGTKLGTATSQKLGFWNATPVVQPTAVADATDAASAVTQLNNLLAKLRTIGIIAT